MIFVTIGAVFPFDRLVRLMDDIAPTLDGEDVFAQIGDGAYEPVNIPFARFVSASEFRARLGACKLLVGHAGMGTVLSALENAKPVVLLPRRLELGEHNTDHQMATARWLATRPGLHVAMGDADLRPAIVEALGGREAREPLSTSAPEAFLRRIRDYIDAA